MSAPHLLLMTPFICFKCATFSERLHFTDTPHKN